MKTSSVLGRTTFALILFAAVTVSISGSLLTSCKNDVQEVRSLDYIDTLPEMTARDVEILYSEKAKVEVKLVSPYLVSKNEEEPVIYFPKGFTVYFYDTTMALKSTITADYGVSYEKKKLMEARHNVVVENLEKGQKLYTEELFWDRNKQLIYSDKYVRLTSGEQVISGDGIRSEEPFDEIFIIHPSGPIEIKEEPGK